MLRVVIAATLGFSLAAAIQPASAQPQGLKADRSSIAIGGNVTNSTVITGIPPEKVDELVRERTKPLELLSTTQQEAIGLLKEKLDLNERQIRAALNILGEADIPPEKLAAKLVEVATQYKILKTSAAADPDDNSKVRSLKADAQKAIEAGDLAKADALLADAQAEQRRALDRSAINFAATAGKRGEIALTRLQYGEAARHFAEAAASLAPNGARDDQRADYLERQAVALYQQGDEFGDVDAFGSAASLWRQLIEMRPRDRAPLDWARMQVNLGQTLITFAKRQSGISSLEEAVVALRAALTEYTRERAPLDWADAQRRLANALREIGEKQRGTAELDEAADALREALKATPRETRRLEWGILQAEIGGVLLATGRKQGDTGKLEEAIASYRIALEEVTRITDPVAWSSIQNNIAVALDQLGERQNDRKRLEEAVAAFRESLKERTRERFPIEWATTQYNLAGTLASLATGDAKADFLKQAIDAYREALKELTQQSAPLYWARLQTNLGNALYRLGKLETGTKALEEAATAYREASKEWTQESFPTTWAMEQANIGDALFAAGERAKNVTHLEAAVAAYRKSLEVRDRVMNRDPVTWARTRFSYCRALWTLGQQQGDSGKKTSAASACRSARDVLATILTAKDKIPLSYAEDAREAMGNFSYNLIIMGDFQGALSAADATLKAFPGTGWVELNRAHALMFLGQRDDARKIYLRSSPSQGESDDWKDSIKSDFKIFREAGLNVPLMNEIERGLAKQK